MIIRHGRNTYKIRDVGIIDGVYLVNKGSGYSERLNQLHPWEIENLDQTVLGPPRLFWWRREISSLVLHPTPDKEYEIRVRHYGALREV